MNVLITGGSGFIGSHLVESLTNDQHQVTILSRSERTSNNRYISYRKWDGTKMPVALGLFDVVVNFAGASIAGSRWTDSYKKLVRSSRVDATRACVEFINKSPRPPKLFISASAVGYYGASPAGRMTEDTPAGNDFLGEVSKEWEEVSHEARIRTVNPRIGVVLGKEGGALPKMVTPYKFFLGGTFGGGDQPFPWIHIEDIVGAMRFFMEKESVTGPVNLTSPEIVDQSTFSGKLAAVLGVMEFMKVPEFALKMLMGEQAVLLTGGQGAVPDKLLSWGYEFKHPNLKEALVDLLG
ncbi:MAG: TIGR01777 family oxidoreductase [Bacteroidota bacterium]